MKKLNISFLISSVLLLSVTLKAEENKNGNRLANTNSSQATGCSPAEARADLDVNNVRALIMTGGDMWWDMAAGEARYEIPKDSKKMSLFSGSLWIGGIDAGGQLKVAAMTYRQTGNDFWPGPISTVDASIDEQTCRDFDKFYKITYDEVSKFYSNYTADPATKDPNYSTPASILNWPGNGNTALNQAQFLAPFYDNNSDLIYNPADGDFPYYDLFGNCGPEEKLYGDQTLWWVFNDKGNIHTESTAQPIGLEIHAQAFGFATNDEVNNMTFYNYTIINRSTFRLDSTYFGMWVDPDLGEATDDYVGCDVRAGLGFCYNSDPIDGDGNGISYGVNPPAIGIDFFQGPLADSDGRDNDSTETFSGTGYSDGIVDNERLGMEKFMYYVNDGSVRGNPDNAAHFYNYLRGMWKDGSRLTFGGSGYNSGGAFTDFAYSWDTDPNVSGNYWEQASEADNRFIHSAGPFSLKPGAVNFITIGAVWARTTQGDPKNSVALMRDADKTAQRLFDNCFKLASGPDAPDVAAQELDRQIILTLGNGKNSNNYLEKYNEYSLKIATPSDAAAMGIRYDSTYDFQGYQIYQLKDATVSFNDLQDQSKAKLVAQVDILDSITTLINYEASPNGGVSANLRVTGENKGIRHSFPITKDLFPTGNDDRLVNHKTYYYMAQAYAYNEYKVYKQDEPYQPSNPLAADLRGQKEPYLSGRRNLKVIAATPHIPSVESGGLIAHSVYGSTPKLKKTEGKGNGGFIIDLTTETKEEILTNGFSAAPTYENGKAPVEVKVVDPLNVPAAEFQLELRDTVIDADVPASVANYDQVQDLANAAWRLTNLTTGEVVNSEKSINVRNEQIISQWGISVTFTQVTNPGNGESPGNGALESTMKFVQETKPWIGFVPDVDGFPPLNWIKAGTALGDDPDFPGIDDNQDYEKLLGGTWAPYRLANDNAGGQAWQTYHNTIPMANLASVDIIMTSDKTKWTRCPVIEMQDNAALADSGAKKFSIRKSPSVDKEGKADNTGTGMSWFPGYAINVETGERLNMAFGEDSWLVSENGKDMMFNPSSRVLNDNQAILFGGKHYIYVFGHNGDGRFSSTDPLLPLKSRDIPRYDEGATLHSLLRAFEHPQFGSNTYKREVWEDAMWCAIPIHDPRYNWLDNDLTVRLRVAKPYTRFSNAAVILPGSASLVVGQCYFVQTGNIRHNNKTYPSGSTFTAKSNDFTPATANSYVAIISSPNCGNPTFTFNTNDLATEKNNNKMAKNALELINVVPNPYYAYSGYETNLTDNRIKITNLPQKCTVSIYTVNGTLIRRFKKDEEKTSLDWDLKNASGIPIASGLYIIHVNADGIGEKVIKWFGVMREVALDTF